MVWRFVKHYGTDKATGMLEEFSSTVVAFDAEAATKGQIVTMQAEPTKLGRRLAEVETEVAHEHRETRERLRRPADQAVARRRPRPRGARRSSPSWVRCRST